MDVDDDHWVSENPFEVETSRDMEIEEEEDGEQEEEDGEQEEDIEFRFKTGVNPLDLVASSEIPMYQRFERLEYEALADKKRKALTQTELPQKKARQGDVDDEITAESMRGLMEAMHYRGRRKRKKRRKTGRQRGSKSKLAPEISGMLGTATLHYAHGRYTEAISVLQEVIRLAPNLPDSYHTLGLVHTALKNDRIAFEFYMLAACFSPKESPLWKLLYTWSIEQGNVGQSRFCLSRAIRADPKDVSLLYDQAMLCLQRKDYQKAAVCYEQVQRLSPDDTEAVKTGAELFKKSNMIDRSVGMLEAYMKAHPAEADMSMVDLLINLLMETKAYDRALQQIEHASVVYNPENEQALNFKCKAGICHAHLNNIEKAEDLFSILQPEKAHAHTDLVTEVADSLMSLEHYRSALKYYHMLEMDAEITDDLHSKIAQCYLYLKERDQAIMFFRKALYTHEDNIDVRLKLAALLVEEAREDEALCLLSPPENLDKLGQTSWWLDGNIKLKLCNIYRSKGMLEEFVNTLFPLVRDSLHIEIMRQKVRVRKRLSRSELMRRANDDDDDDQQNDSIFPWAKPVTDSYQRMIAARARKRLEIKATRKEETKAAVIAVGLEWQSDDSDDEPLQVSLKEPPLPSLFKDDAHHNLIIDLCKDLVSLKRYAETLEVIKLALKLAHSTFPVEKKEVLQSLGTQMAYFTMDPNRGIECIKYIVQQHPYSFAAWNCYYKVVSRSRKRHSKFLRYMRVKYKGCVPTILISGHQWTVASHHQDAARDYLEAYKLLPENPLINLCAGSALISLALGFRLQNKHQCLVQGLAFLYNNLRICNNSQEALYNIARACQQVGLVTLAAQYYEKVLGIAQKDFPIPKLPNESLPLEENQEPGYCNLRREAAYNLHLIYKKSGALDLARQILKDHCTF